MQISALPIQLIKRRPVFGRLEIIARPRHAIVAARAVAGYRAATSSQECVA